MLLARANSNRPLTCQIIDNVDVAVMLNQALLEERCFEYVSNIALESMVEGRVGVGQCWFG